MDIWSDSIASAALVVNGLFAYLVWKATKQSSEISKKLFERDEEYNSVMRDHYRRRVLDFMDDVVAGVDTIGTTTGKILFGPLMKLGGGFNLSPDEFAGFFTVDEKRMIEAFWDDYMDYVNQNCVVPNLGFFLQEEQINEEKTQSIISASKRVASHLHELAEKVRQNWGMQQFNKGV
jgi:hypothetical protein